MWYEIFINKKILPDWVIRKILRAKLQNYANVVSSMSPSELDDKRKEFVEKCLSSDVALHTDVANSQHYELPILFYEYILSKEMKYSGSFWDSEDSEIDEVDTNTLQTYMNRIEIESCNSILDLGAGWGALTLAIAECYPGVSITALTNSSIQANYINMKARHKGFQNVKVVKEDVQKYNPSNLFDRIVSIEMFEHMRNPEIIMKRAFTWLNSEGKLFLQVFSHRTYPQFFDNVESSWMSKNFFTGGLMPYDGFYTDIRHDLVLKRIWRESGISYHHTLEAWLNNLDRNREKILPHLDACRMSISSRVFLQQYRFFLIFCSELFNFNNGNDWYVINYLFDKTGNETC